MCSPTEVLQQQKSLFGLGGAKKAAIFEFIAY
jgi:hypothetical protein